MSVPKSRPRAAGRPIWVLLAISLLFVGAVLIYSIVYFGFVEGQEFAPESFSRREFSFYEIPVLGLQVSPIERTDISNDLELHLVNQSLVSAPKTTPPNQRWDLVIAERGAVPSARRLIEQGEARILCEYLDTTDSEQESIWLKWTRDHPSLAKTLWPIVARLARQELYIFVPDLFVLARDARDPDRLQADLHRLLVQKCLAFGRAQQALNKHRAAVELFTEALAHDPGNAEVLSARANSWKNLGEAAKAGADLAAAKQLEPP